MADRLYVAGDSLSSLATRMSDAAALLDNEVSGLSGREAGVGHQGVTGAVAAFERHWGDGRTRVRTQAEQLAQILRDSIVAYDDTESQLTSALREGGTRPTNAARAV